MTPYIILILAVDAAVLIAMTLRGAKRGFAGTFSQVFSLAVAIVVVVLVSSVIHGYQNGDRSNLIIGILLLIVLGAVYKLIRAVLTSIRFLAALPILDIVDKALGLVIGFIEGFALLYIAEYLLRMYLLR